MSFTRPTKHKPHKEDPHGLRLRKVEYPKRVERQAHESEGFEFGLREPPEGRYSTLSRETYRTEQRSGDIKASARTHDEIQLEQKQRAKYMTERHFYLPQKDGNTAGELYVSEARGSHISPPKEVVLDSHAHGHGEMTQLMKAHNMFVSDRAVDEWNKTSSTNRADYVAPSVQLMSQLKGEARSLKSLQQGTHFLLGTCTDPMASESRSMHNGEQDPAGKTKKILNATLTTVNIGTSDVKPADTLRSLKQVDFVKHHVPAPVRQASNICAKHNFVLGYSTEDPNSLYRVSFPPTEFVPPES